MASQLSLDLPPAPQADAEAFFLTPATAAAHAAVTGPADWPRGKLALIGPACAGKTHLARLWSVRAGAEIIPSARLEDAIGRALPPPGAALALEDADTLPRAAEETLFHLWNHLDRTGGRLLITARTAPARWDIALPDLASRLQSIAVVRIGDPDDRLLALLLAKHLAERHILPAAGVIPYLVARMERSHAAARLLAARLDGAAMAQGRGVTRDLARSILDNRAPPAR
jgi:chromosomal replication initiation ATPase DnaA